MRISDWSSDVCSSDLEARGQDYVAVEGPYAIAEGDVRIHMVRAEGSGHRIREHRCLGAELGARDWPHGMGTGDAEEPFTIESVARKAEWLKRSEEHTSELQSLMRTSYAVFCLQNKKQHTQQTRQLNQAIQR